MVGAGASLHLMRYRTAQHRIDGVRRLRRVERQTRQGLLSTLYHHTDTADLVYTIRGPEAWRAQVTATYTQFTEFSIPIVIGQRSSEDSDREIHQQILHSTQDLRIDGDTTRVWRLEMVQSFGDSVSPTAAMDVRLRLDKTEYEVVAMTAAGPLAAKSRPVVTLLPQTSGWMVTGDGLPILVVQTSGGGILGQNDWRLWMPRNITAADRNKRTALAMMILASTATSPFGGAEH